MAAVARGKSPPMFLHRPRFRLPDVFCGSSRQLCCGRARLAVARWCACRLRLRRLSGGAVVRRQQAVWWIFILLSLFQCVCVRCNLLQL
jgi:hypothetical protein